MKIRTDFVTNSSSSSFIIALKNTEENKKIAKSYLSDDYYGDGRIINNEDELSKFLIKYTYSNDILEVLVSDYGKELFSKISEVINEDFIVVYTEISRDIYLHDDLSDITSIKNDDKYLIEKEYH